MIELDVDAPDAHARLLAHIDAGEEFALVRAGEILGIVRPVVKAPGRRVLGIWDHLGLDLPEDLFIGPDPETLAAVDGPIFPDDDEAAA